MTLKEEIEIVIGKDGEVHVHTHGMKGKKCLEYIKILGETVGKIKEQILTSEYYEPEPDVEIKPKIEDTKR